MNHTVSCRELLPTQIAVFLPTDLVEQINLDCAKCSSVHEPVMFLINKCSKFLFNSTYSSAEFHKELSQCLRHTKAALDITWEKLNTGYWKDVDISWRYIYSYASLFKSMSYLLDKNPDRKEVIKACDMGLIMGAPILDNILSKIAFIMSNEQAEKDKEVKYCKRQKTCYYSDEPEEQAIIIPVIEYPLTESFCPSLEEFKENHLDKKLPVVLKSTIDFWPSLSSRRWSIDYLMKIARHRTVPIEIGSKYTDENWTQKLVTIDEFVTTYIFDADQHTKTGYLAQYQLFEQIPLLKEDFSVPTYCCLTDQDAGEDVDISAWFGPSGTVSPLHYDPKNNLLAQVMGEKYVRLYLEEYTPMLYPTDCRLLENTSRVEVENPDMEKFPLFANAPYQEYILTPGDMLFIPPKCWHYVRSLSTSFSISFWWK